MILTSLQKISSNVGDLGKIIVATSFEWLPKVKKIAQSGHTGRSIEEEGEHADHLTTTKGIDCSVTRFGENFATCAKV